MPRDGKVKRVNGRRSMAPFHLGTQERLVSTPAALYSQGKVEHLQKADRGRRSESPSRETSLLAVFYLN